MCENSAHAQCKSGRGRGSASDRVGGLVTSGFPVKQRGWKCCCSGGGSAADASIRDSSVQTHWHPRKHFTVVFATYGLIADRVLFPNQDDFGVFHSVSPCSLILISSSFSDPRCHISRSGWSCSELTQWHFTSVGRSGDECTLTRCEVS